MTDLPKIWCAYEVPSAISVNAIARVVERATRIIARTPRRDTSRITPISFHNDDFFQHHRHPPASNHTSTMQIFTPGEFMDVTAKGLSNVKARERTNAAR